MERAEDWECYSAIVTIITSDINTPTWAQALLLDFPGISVLSPICKIIHMLWHWSVVIFWNILIHMVTYGCKLLSSQKFQLCIYYNHWMEEHWRQQLFASSGPVIPKRLSEIWYWFGMVFFLVCGYMREKKKKGQGKKFFIKLTLFI